MNNARRLLRDNRGDIYLQMIICTTLFLIIVALFVGVITSANKKLTLEDQLNDIATIVTNTGSVRSDKITEIANDIVTKYGGRVLFDGDFVDESLGLVQLNDVVYVRYVSDSMDIAEIASIDINTAVDLASMSRSNVYWKEYAEVPAAHAIVPAENTP